MGRSNYNDAIDRIILGKLCLYESLDIVQLWYELTGDGALKKHMAREEILSRLESLKDQGLVEQKMEGNGHKRWWLRRREVCDDQGRF